MYSIKLTRAGYKEHVFAQGYTSLEAARKAANNKSKAYGSGVFFQVITLDGGIKSIHVSGRATYKAPKGMFLRAL